MQTVMTDVLVGSRANPRVYRGLQHRRPQRVSGIEVQRFQHACRNGYRTYDNQTEDSAEELLIGHTNARLQGQVINQNMERSVSVAMVAVHMMEMGDGTRDKILGHL